MKVYGFCFIFSVVLIGLSNAQTYCTLASLCNDGSIIDPRISYNGGGAVAATRQGIVPNIVSPVGPYPISCPAGYVACSSITCGTPTVQPSYQDGYATANAFPWQVFLRNNLNLAVRNGYAGGGVLLDPYTVLTAAHKISNLSSISVLVGIYNVADLSTSQSAQVAQVWIHSNYNQTYLKNDVAILRLATPVLINNNAMPICLPAAGSNYIGLPTTSCVVSGWGQTSFTVNDAPTQTLKQVHVPIVSNAQCVTSYTNILGSANTAAYLDLPNELCAGGSTQLDACTQDGGSPLVCSGATGQFSLVGLVLWGKDCGQTGRYGVYLNVPQYLYWIQCTQQCAANAQNCAACPATQFL